MERLRPPRKACASCRYSGRSRSSLKWNMTWSAGGRHVASGAARWLAAPFFVSFCAMMQRGKDARAQREYLGRNEAAVRADAAGMRMDASGTEAGRGGLGRGGFVGAVDAAGGGTRRNGNCAERRSF